MFSPRSGHHANGCAGAFDPKVAQPGKTVSHPRSLLALGSAAAALTI